MKDKKKHCLLDHPQTPSIPKMIKTEVPLLRKSSFSCFVTWNWQNLRSRDLYRRLHLYLRFRTRLVFQRNFEAIWMSCISGPAQCSRVCVFPLLQALITGRVLNCASQSSTCNKNCPTQRRDDVEWTLMRIHVRFPKFVCLCSSCAQSLLNLPSHQQC